MPTSDHEEEIARLERELKIQRQIAFAAGLFQENITVRTLLESLAEGVVVIDSAGTILQVNNSAEKMFGYPKIELIGKPHSLLIPERFRKVHDAHQAHYFKDPKVRRMGELLDLAGRRKDGSEFPVEISLSYIETTNGILVLALVSDITLRKQYEASLQESDDLFRIQVECVNDYAVFMLDPRGNVLNWNAGAERLKGYRNKEVIGRHFSCFYPEEDRQAGKPENLLQRAAAEGRVKDQGWQLRKDGSRFWADVIITALRDENGDLRGYSKVTHDITERRRAEEALREAKAAAEKASRSKSEFLANMSHEIRTPMTVFLAALEHLLQIESNPEHRHLLEMADKSARRLRALIDDVLDFSRIEARRVDLEEEPFDLRGCVREAVDMFALLAREKNLRLVADVSPNSPPIVVGDPHRLSQVLTNLVGNAVKFTHDGEVRVSLQPRGDFLEFSIADTGIGIPEEKRHLLFESFTQLDASFHRKFGGSGLGLAISKGLVELMGGRIEVQSRDGGGSLFTFSIPLKTAESRGSQPLPTLQEESGRGILATRILLAEDDAMIQELITLVLAKRGWYAESAVTGLEAIEKWEKGAFGIVLMDLQMPDMDGMEATQAIREREAEVGRRTCIIGLTAHALSEIQNECLKAGMDEVLTKPVQMRDLYSAIDRCLAE
jgi:PAS domain S-box-containing protein